MLASGEEYSNQMPEIFYLYLRQLYFAEREIKFVYEIPTKKISLTEMVISGSVLVFSEYFHSGIC